MCDVPKSTSGQLLDIIMAWRMTYLAGLKERVEFFEAKKALRIWRLLCWFQGRISCLSNTPRSLLHDRYFVKSKLCFVYLLVVRKLCKFFISAVGRQWML